MAQQAQRMQTLVSDLLTLSRLEGSPLPGAGEWTPAAALPGAVRAGGAGAGRRRWARSWSCASMPRRRWRWRGVAERAAERLVQPGEQRRALHARRRQRRGAAAQALPDGRCEFAVRDTGPGIAAEHLPRLTERFYRVDRSRSRETGGTGLGLAIVKHVVQRHGGELRIESTPGAGSTFAIVLPGRRACAPLDAYAGR